MAEPVDKESGHQRIPERLIAHIQKGIGDLALRHNVGEDQRAAYMVMMLIPYRSRWGGCTPIALSLNRNVKIERIGMNTCMLNISKRVITGWSVK